MTKTAIPIAAGALGLVLAASAHAQVGESRAAPSVAPVVTADIPCPPNGYAKPLFGGASDNDGILRGYEIASPCIIKEAIAAADALGMARGNPLGVKSIVTSRFGATGTIVAERGSPMRYADIDVATSYAIPATRITVRATGGAGESGRVVADGKAWDEDAPGIGARKAPAGAVAARAPLMRLTPYGALLAVIEAEGHATASRKDGRTVLTGTSPYDGYRVTVTLDDKNLPSAAEVRAGAKVYRATFAGYTDKWEPPYLYPFPARIVWTLDGKPYADLTVVRFHSNPYVVFPVPAAAAN